MNDKLDAALRSTSVVVLSDDKSTGMLFRNVGFNNVEITKADLSNALPIITGPNCDLLVMETIFDNQPTTKIIRSIREGEIGENMFLPVIILISSDDEKGIGENINAGADDIVMKPLSVKLVHDRIGGFLNRKIQYSVTSNYIGPNRRPKERTNASKDGLIEVPNLLKAKTEGAPIPTSEMRAQVSEARQSINGVRFSALGDQISLLISRVIAEPQNFVEVIDAIKTVSQDFTTRLENTDFAHVSEMCLILNKVIEDVKGIDDKRNVELLILLGQAISMSFEKDTEATMRAMEVVKLIKEKL